MPAMAAPAPRAKARALAVTRNDRRDDDDAIVESPPGCDRPRRRSVLFSSATGRELLGLPSHEAEHRCCVEKGQAESPLQARADEPEPREMNESRAEERQEQPVAAGGRDAENADALGRRA